jgi:acyl-CoA synthetase (AMP-forming)/AMP-acid ligase II
MASPLAALLRTSAERYPDRPALAWRQHEWTYRGLSAAAERLAARLPPEVTAGQRVGVLAPNTPALLAGLFAAWCRGAVAVPLSSRWREYELRRVLQDAAPVALISVASHHGYDFADLLAGLLPALPALRSCQLTDDLGEVTGELPGLGALSPEPLAPDVGILLYTSGTTGVAKGALTRARTFVDAAPALNDLLGATPEDVGLFVIPVAHAFGLGTVLAALAAGSLAVLVDSTFSPAAMLEAIRHRRATVLHGSPALFTGFLKLAPRGLSPLRTGFVAGASCPPQVLEQLDRAGLLVLNLYGMTEIGAATCCRPGDPAGVRYTTVGRPLPGYEVRIAGGEHREVQVRGPGATPGYHRLPEQTAAGYDGDWFRTGDLGSLDGSGNLCLSGRAKEVIHVGGLNVFPAEVEGFLLTHPDVLQAAVVGVANERMGEVPQAFVVPRPGAGLTPAALLQFARARIAGYKLPYVIRLLPELPLLASGKPDRAALARSAQEEAHAEPGTRADPAL